MLRIFARRRPPRRLMRKRAMPSFTTIQERHTVIVSTAEIELAFSLDDGGLRMLRRAGGPNVIGYGEGRALEPAPTQSPGLLALYDHETDETLFCWYYSPVEVALPQVEGNGEAVTLLHQVELADRLGAEVALSSGTQYILLLREPWPR